MMSWLSRVGRRPGADIPACSITNLINSTEANNVHYWLLLLWDRIVIMVCFHDPACTCEACKPAR
jgi:hypothetical protein